MSLQSNTLRAKHGAVVEIDGKRYLVKRCPCCCGTEIYTGHMTAFVMCVECVCCGLTMPVPWGRVKQTGRTPEEIDAACLKRAVKQWNTRRKVI